MHRLAITKPQNARQVTIMTDMTDFQAETPVLRKGDLQTDAEY